MLLHIPQILSAEDLVRVREMVSALELVSGSGTATGIAASVKNNLQLPHDHQATIAAGAFLISRLRANPLFELAAQPRAFSRPLFSRYDTGMSYGFHLDAPIMDAGPAMRTDIATTVFLSAKDDYDGGELVSETGLGEQGFKGDAGDCVIYPATTFHRVAEVTRGTRMVAAFWIQSLVRDPAKREILYDLGCSQFYLDVMGGAGPYTERIRRSYNNLLRLWAEL